jgi:hypothetical protein
MEDDRSKEQVLKARLARERAAARKRGKQRVRFSLEVRREAVELSAASGRTREQFALDMGLSKTALHRWSRPSQRGAVAFHHVKVEQASIGAEAEALVVIFPSGARLMGLSWEQLRQLVGVTT